MMRRMTARKSLRRQLLFIVSRERMDLYDALRQALSEEADCEVVLERRASERRSRGGSAPDGRDRRDSHRREPIPLDSEIRDGGWATVKANTLPEAKHRAREPRPLHRVPGQISGA